jgi:pyruvate/2-oxoglutarate dehydrogenase complex dihydrolipoamide dehydrogenase (E3) component
VHDFRSDVEESLEIENLTVVRGEAKFIALKTVQVLGEGETRVLTAEIVVIATGTQNRLPKVEGLDGVPFLTSTSILESGILPAHLLVMGGGYIAVEMAQAFRRFGARVTIIEKNARLLSKEDPDVSQAVREILERGGIEIVTGAEVKSAAQNGDKVSLQVLAGEETRAFRGSHLLVATGRQPATEALDLEAAGIERDDKGFVRVDEFLSTNQDGVFALGDVAKSPPFTHIAYDDARILADRILRGEKRSTKERILTWTVFIDPQLGHVGLSEKEACDKNLQFDVARIDMDQLARPLETGEAQGFWKVLVERGSGQILGGTFLSMEGGEMAALCLVAMVGKLPYTTLRDLPISHPTLAESFNNLFLKFDRERSGAAGGASTCK